MWGVFGVSDWPILLKVVRLWILAPSPEPCFMKPPASSVVSRALQPCMLFLDSQGHSAIRFLLQCLVFVLVLASAQRAIELRLSYCYSAPLPPSSALFICLCLHPSFYSKGASVEVLTPCPTSGPPLLSALFSLASSTPSALNVSLQSEAESDKQALNYNKTLVVLLSNGSILSNSMCV